MKTENYFKNHNTRKSRLMFLLIASLNLAGAISAQSSVCFGLAWLFLGCWFENACAARLDESQTELINMQMEYIKTLEESWLEECQRQIPADRLEQLVAHMHIHSNYKTSGYNQMTTEQKALFDAVIQRQMT